MKTFLIASFTLLVALMLGASVGPPAMAEPLSSDGVVPSNWFYPQEESPYTFFFTRPEMLGDPNNPTGVRYHSDGKLFAKAPDGSRVILSGKGAWDPDSKTAQGGGRYTIEDASGTVTARGLWRVTDFSSFEQLDGWWGMGPEFKEKGWQGPPGSASFSGFLTLKVNLEGQGDGTLVAWCLMPEVLERHPHLVNPDGHVSDGISLTEGEFDFTEFKEGEMSGPPYQGVMFYSTDPSSEGYVLTSDGHTVHKKPASETLPEQLEALRQAHFGDPTAGATASPGATAAASPTALATIGGASLLRPLTLVAAPALIGFGVAGLALLRRGFSRKR